MPSQEMFVRDPRELPFVRNEVQKLLSLADSSSRGVRVREDDSFGFMVMQFLYKQIQHAESVLELVPSRDAGLIARTMIEGLYQLLWASQAPDERAKLWRSFSVIHDWRLIQGRLKAGIPVGDADILKNEAGLKEFGSLHLMKKARPNSLDPYHKNWRAGVTLSDIADRVGRELYEGPYAELSDWEHWGVSGIGDSISRKDDHVTVEPNSERVADLSLLAAFQSLLQTLQVANVHLSLNLNNPLQRTEREFVATMDSFQRDQVLPNPVSKTFRDAGQ